MAASGLQAQQPTVDKSSLAFFAQNAGQPVQQTLNVTSTPAGTFFTASLTETDAANAVWLKFPNGVQNTTGTTPQALTIMADPTNLTPGTYRGSVVISAPQIGGNPTLTVPVVLTVSSIGANPSSVTFSYQTGGAVPAPQSITLTSVSTTTFVAGAATSNGGSWLNVAPTSGTISGGATTVSAILDSNTVSNLAAGTYTGTITINPTNSGTNIPVNVPVTLTVSTAPPVTVSSTAIQLNFQIGGTNNQAQQVLTLSTTSTQTLSYAASFAPANNPSGRSFIIVNPSNGTIPANGSTPITISYDTTANLPAGTWTGVLTLFTPGASPAQQNVNVSLLVSSSPLLSVPNAGLTFVYELNSGTNPAAQTVTASSTAVAPGATTGQMVVAASASANNGGSWLAVNPTIGTTGTATPFTVTVNPAGLIPGKYTGTVTFTGTNAGNGAQSVPVTLTVANDPSLLTNLSSLAFESQIGQAAVATAQSSQTLTVTSSTGATLNYAATANTTTGGSWLVVSGNITANSPNAFTASLAPSVVAGLAAGTYTGNVTITATNPATGNAAVNSPLVIPVTLYVSSNPLLVVTLPGNPPSQPVFTAQVNGGTTATQSVVLQSTNPSAPLNYNVSFTTASGGNWLFAAPLSGTTSPGSNVIAINTQPGILSPGTYTGTVTVTATSTAGAVANSPYTIPITFQVTAGTIQLSQTSLQFAQTAGGTAPASQTVQVTSNGQPLNFQAVANTTSSVSWLSVSPTTGSTAGSGTLTISVDGSKLSAGTYTGTITVTSPNASNSPATINVTLTVAAGNLAAAPTSLTFAQVQGGSIPASQTISVTSTPNAVNFSIAVATTSGGNWLSAAVVAGAATSVTGTTPASVSVSANGTSLAAGQYTGTLTITAPGATGSPLSIPVTLNVSAPQTITVTPAGTLNFAYTIGTTAPTAQQVQLTSTGSTTFTATASTTDGAKWLSVTPAGGSLSTTATSLSIGVNPTGLAAGNYTGSVSVSTANTVTPVLIPVALTVSAIPTPTLLGIRNAGSGFLGAIAPGEIIAIYGTGIGPVTPVGTQITSSGKVSTNIGNTQVLFDGSVAAPIIFASAAQTNVVVPYEVAGRPSTTITVVYSGVSSAGLTYSVQPTVPGLYTLNLSGSGPGAILNQDFSVNGTSHPAAAGSIVAVYMTGDGLLAPPPITGGVAPSGVTYNTVASVTATIGGQTARVTYSGTAPGLVFGATQVNVQIPAGLASGAQPIVITMGGVASQPGVTLVVQ